MKKQLAILCVILVLLTLTFQVSAHEVPDLERVGSISFSMLLNGKPLNSGSFAMFRVGDVLEEDGNYYFSLVEALQGTDISLDNMADTSLAQTLAQAAQDAGIEYASAEVREGYASFDQVENGLYVVMQFEEEACENLLPINAFLISMPMYSGGSYVYEISCKPKVSLELDPNDPDNNPVLPPTGQKALPIELLGVSGIALLVLGWYAGTKRRKASDA